VFQKAWSTFAEDPQNGLTELGWPEYNPIGKIIPAKLPAEKWASLLLLEEPKG